MLDKYLKEHNGQKLVEIPLSDDGSVTAWYSLKLTDQSDKPAVSLYSVDDDNYSNETDDSPFFQYLNSKDVDIKSRVSLKQVHGCGVISVECDSNGSFQKGIIGIGDALITNSPGIPLLIKTADCLSVQLYDTSSGSIANIHYGWRSGAKNIITLTIARLKKYYEFKPEKAVAVMMPSILQENYKVGSDVNNTFKDNIDDMDRFFRSDIDGGWWFDLRGTAKEMLIRAGIRAENIKDIDSCTFHNEELFYSYRRDGKGTGRMLAVIHKKK